MKVLELIDGKWDYFGERRDRNQIEYANAHWHNVVDPDYLSEVLVGQYSLNDFANNRSVINALQQCYH